MITRKTALKRFFGIFLMGFILIGLAKKVFADYVFDWAGNEMAIWRDDATSEWGVLGDITLGGDSLALLRPHVASKIDLGNASFPFNKLFLSDDLTIIGGNIITDTATGIKIGTSTSQKLGFYNVTTVNQPITVADPSVDTTSNNTAIKAIIDRLQELGLIA